MHLTDFARQLPQEVWELFEPLLPPVVWQRPPPSEQLRLLACTFLRPR